MESENRVRQKRVFTGSLLRKLRFVGGDKEAGTKKIKINYRDTSRCARRASQIKQAYA